MRRDDNHQRTDSDSREIGLTGEYQHEQGHEHDDAQNRTQLGREMARITKIECEQGNHQNLQADIDIALEVDAEEIG